MGFNAGNHPKDSDQGQGYAPPVPEGIYNVTVRDARFMTTKSEKVLDDDAISWLVLQGDDDAKDGRTRAGDKARNVYVTLEVNGPNHKGREIREWHLYAHPSITAMKIGREKIAELSAACNVMEWEQPSDLVGSEIVVHTRVERDPRYGDKCKVKLYRTGGEVHVGEGRPSFDDEELPF
jgi:hypothetical protein